MFKGCVRQTEILFEENTESVYRVVLGQDGSMIQTDELFAFNIEEMMPHLLIPIGKNRCIDVVTKRNQKTTHLHAFHRVLIDLHQS